MITVNDLSLSYPGRSLLAGCDAEFEPGLVYGLVAPNGFGKTTLLKALAGLRASQVSGEILVDGRPPFKARDNGLVFYAPGNSSLLYPALTGADHLRMVGDLWQGSRGIREVAQACRMEGFLKRRVRGYSQGMRQQLTLAIAYMTGAKYLFLDEPMNALDPTNVKRQTDIVRCLAKGGACILLSSHILQNVDEVCDRTLFLSGKRLIAFDGMPGMGAQKRYEELYLPRQRAND